MSTAPAPGRAETMGDERCGGRQEVVRRRCGESDEPDRAAVDPGFRQRHLTRLDREVRQASSGAANRRSTIPVRRPSTRPGLEAEPRFDFVICHAPLGRIVSEREKCRSHAPSIGRVPARTRSKSSHD